MRILIVEDDQVLADGLLRTLRSSGAAVDHVASGSEADAALMTNTEFDLVILDLGLPKMHGLEVLKKLRARGSSLPVLILTAADSVEERVKGLDYGADDYMAKPFSLQELEARVRALGRRGMGTASSMIKHGPLLYDQSGRVATIDGVMVELSARELGLLEVLLQRAGRLVSKDQLVERLCEWGEEVSNNAIEVYIHRLRKKIEKGPVRIATVRGLGYCLEKIPGGWVNDAKEPVSIADGTITLPSKQKVLSSMEELIHQFMLVTEGVNCPPGEIYFGHENPKGELGFYINSKGGGTPYRLKIRAPSFVNLSILGEVLPGCMISDVPVILGSLDFVMGECDR